MSSGTIAQVSLLDGIFVQRAPIREARDVMMQLEASWIVFT